MGNSVWTDSEPQNLIGASIIPTIRRAGSLAAAQIGKVGWVLGKILVAAGTAAAKAGGNTGTGTLTGFALAAGGPAKVGTYRVRCILAQADAGVFTVVDPDGIIVGIVIAAITTGTVFTGGGITFTLTTVHSADFIVGDGFDLPVAAGAGTLRLLDRTAVDGSNKFDSILLVDKTTVGSALPVATAIGGEFLSQGLIFAAGTVLADVINQMTAAGCYVVTSSALENTVGR
jgi:hypothetical protein